MAMSTVVAVTPMRKLPLPTQSPIVMARKTYARSTVSLITVRKRISDMAPTVPNARATLPPITRNSTLMMQGSSASARTNDLEYCSPLCVRW